jgi:hypothetical protein
MGRLAYEAPRCNARPLLSGKGFSFTFRKPPRWSRLDLAYTRQHCFPEELERMHDTLRIINSGALKE